MTIRLRVSAARELRGVVGHWFNTNAKRFLPRMSASTVGLMASPSGRVGRKGTKQRSAAVMAL